MQQSIHLDRAARRDSSSKGSDSQPGSPLRSGYSPGLKPASGGSSATSSPIHSPLPRNSAARRTPAADSSAGNSSPLARIAPPVDNAVAFIGRFFAEGASAAAAPPPTGALSPFKKPATTPVEGDSPSRPVAPPPPPASKPVWGGTPSKWDGSDLAPGQAILF
jgi:hypothetical protein